MNILFAYPTCFNPQRGGVERVTDILAKSLLEKGHNVFYLNWSGEKDNIEYPASIFYLPSSDLEDPKNLRAYNNFLVKIVLILLLINMDYMKEPIFYHE